MAGIPFNVILLIDDNEQNRYTMARYLKKAGYEIWEAGDGARGLELARNNPALIVLDIQLPDMSGFDVCATLKADPATAVIPVLHTSAAFVQSADRVRGLNGGADGYLIDPIEPEEMVATVRALLRARQAEFLAHNLAAQWEATFDAMKDGICLVTINGVIERCNQAFADIVGAPRHELISKSFVHISAQSSLNETPYCRMLKSREREVVECNRGEQWFRITADPVRTRSGIFAGAVYIMTDLTRNKEAENRLQLMASQLQQHMLELEKKVNERTEALHETVKSLDNFCYSVAHDLKSPLRSIKGFSSILREDYAPQLDAVAQDYADRIVKSVDRMQRLIDDLLDYGRLAHSEVPITTVSLDEEMNTVLMELSAEIQAKQATIDVPKKLPSVQANPTLLRQCLVNILSNALKFVAKEVQPKVLVSVEQKPGAVRLWIRDNGIGIAPANMGRIFNMFERLHGKDSAYPGTGIGLAVVRKAMEKMGGSVGVEPGPDGGSRFWIDVRSA